MEIYFLRIIMLYLVYNSCINLHVLKERKKYIDVDLIMMYICGTGKLYAIN
jgi:hypothetical protein